MTGNGCIGRIIWQKNVLNRTVSSRDGTDLGIIADVTFGEGLKEGLIVVKNRPAKRTLLIASPLLESVDDSVIVADAASFESLSQRDAEAIQAKGLLNKPVASSSGCDVGHVRDFTIDPNSKEIGLMVGVSIQAFHLEITIPWSKIDAIDELLKYLTPPCCICA